MWVFTVARVDCVPVVHLGLTDKAISTLRVDNV